MKTENEYQKLLSVEFYQDCPKAVLAAIAVSLAIRAGADPLEPGSMLYDEWHALHDNGIVPQKPPKY